MNDESENLPPVEVEQSVDAAAAIVSDDCEQCRRPKALCVCDAIKPCKTTTSILILRHPQEPDKLLGSANIAHRVLSNSVLRTGLSWRNLSAAVGREVVGSEWGVLFLGSAKLHTAVQKNSTESPLVFLDRKEQVSKEKPPRLKGIVVLDGTWSQAKALWWRNAWLLKLHRVVLNPSDVSRYGKLRREPRRECVSTLESIAVTLKSLEKGFDPAVLMNPFDELLRRYHEWPNKPRIAGGMSRTKDRRGGRNRRVGPSGNPNDRRRHGRGRRTPGGGAANPTSPNKE